MPYWAVQGTFADGSINSYAVYTNGSTTLKIPIVGFRRYTNGSMAKVGSMGYCWTSSIGGDNMQGFYLFLHSDVCGPFGNNGSAIGLPIRCVRE